ncbi:threonine--tRNA ligase [candidate division KSB1 bacterium]|nr:threonine--tRNA ligase [candidate division KSB1 bacterium]
MKERRGTKETVNISFPDDSKKAYPRGVTPRQIAAEVYSDRDKEFIAALANGNPTDLTAPIAEDASIRFLMVNDPEGKRIFWHSAAHIMAQAVKHLYPQAKLGIGPPTKNGFYYDFRMDSALSTEDLARIEAHMRALVEADLPFERTKSDKKKAISLFRARGEPFKVQLIQGMDGEVHIYRQGEFADLCRGPHVPSTGWVKFFKLLSLAGAYWKGIETNPVMQRIYGTAYATGEELQAHLDRLEEAKLRDHRKLGKELDLFSFHPEGPGFPFWHPKGMVIYNEAVRYWRDVHHRSGYGEVQTPMILNNDLWRRSGHWDNYKQNMYFTRIDRQPYAVKPMNCPGGLLIYKDTPHSYKEFPIRMAELGLVHRHEKSGVLHGLFRVRQFTQDDAHIFCLPDQVEEEIIGVIDLVYEIYGAFGFKDVLVELSTKPQKSIGSAEDWKRAESTLKSALEKRELAFELNEGEGAFYGPKIDFHIQDFLGRFWQCGTIQLDFSMPQHFELEYVGADGKKHQPMMIHRAILGSIERFIGILIEHYGGDLPLWLSPVQARIIPITDSQHSYAHSLKLKLDEQGMRVEVDDRSEKMGYKIRDAELGKVPYMLVVGKDEAQKGTVSVRKRKIGDLGTMTPDQLLARLHEEIEKRKI